MKKFRIPSFKRGWIIGDFKPSLIKTQDFEIAVQFYKKGDKEPVHTHKIADEFTIVTKGRCLMMGQIINEGEGIWIRKGEATGFEAIDDCATTVIKVPSVKGDKYII